jgi:hypothetical protein
LRGHLPYSLIFTESGKMIDFHVAPPAFNPDSRPGIGKAISLAYSQYCESDAAPKTLGPCKIRAAKYQEIHDSLVREFPSLREMKNSQG